MDEAGYCDELVLLREGEVLARGTPDELRERAHTHDLADAFLQSNAFEHARVRFDVASVWLGARGPDVEIFEDAF